MVPSVRPQNELRRAVLSAVLGGSSTTHSADGLQRRQQGSERVDASPTHVAGSTGSTPGVVGVRRTQIRLGGGSRHRWARSTPNPAAATTTTAEPHLLAPSAQCGKELASALALDRVAGAGLDPDARPPRLRRVELEEGLLGVLDGVELDEEGSGTVGVDGPDCPVA